MATRLDELGNIEGYNDIPDNIITENDDMGVRRAKQAAQLKYYVDQNYKYDNPDITGELVNEPNVRLSASTDATPEKGDKAYSPLLGTDTEIKGQTNGKPIVGYSDNGSPIIDETVQVTQKAIKETEYSQDDNSGNSDTPSAIRSVVTSLDIEHERTNVSTINQRKYYVSPPKDAISCYVQNNLTGTVIEFLISPEDISDNMSAQFDDIAPKNRTSPIKGYNNSGPRDISFNITLHNDYCKDGILHTVRQLQALTLPTKSTGFVNAPSCRVVIGKMINIEGVCTSVGVSWKKPYHDEIYSMAEISLSFNEVQRTSVFAEEWERKDD